MFKKSMNARQARTAIFFISPVLVHFTIFFWGPLFFIIVISLSKWDMFNPIDFIGLKNYIAIFSDAFFLKSLYITLTYVLSTTFLLVFFGMMTAILFNRPGPIAALARALFIMTTVLPIISAGAIWVWITGPEPFSGLNLIMRFFGLQTKKWLNDPHLALLCVIGFNIWKNTGFNCLIFTAGLRGIPNEYFDSARVDGASVFQVIKYITIPLLKSTALFLFITNMISGFGLFAPVYFLTKGGPGSATHVLTTYIYLYGFGRYQYGYAAASSIVLICLALIGTVFSLRKA